MKNFSFKKYAILLLSTMMLGGCSQSEPVSTSSSASTEETTSAVKEAKPIADIYDEISKSVTLVSPFCWDEEYISNYYGIDPSVLEEYVFSISEDATSAETVIIMKAKDASDLPSLSDCLQMVVDEKKNEMENYLPEQFAIVEKSSVKTKEPYVYLVISENNDAITKIIEENIQ